jgi:hypothetical protein
MSIETSMSEAGSVHQISHRDTGDAALAHQPCRGGRDLTPVALRQQF